MPEQDFEQILTQGRVRWITAFTYDIAARSLVISLTHEPDKTLPQRVVRFVGVERIESRWQDRDNESQEMLLGGHEFPTPCGFDYILITDQREIELAVTTQVSVTDV